ncbi:endomucin isoform X1 [Manacus candei]|uniref:endomucin isoform X1 n=1 Tax=Manacus candei TaxID=415023 RepID=UPI0022279E9D|nr:endomucin isoform X1 [Manacus candei]
MKLLGIAFFFLAVLCVCAVGEDGIPTPTLSSTISASGSKSVTESMKTSTSQVTPSQASVPTTTVIGATTESITNTSMSSLSNATQGITQDTTTQAVVKVTTTTPNESFSTINPTQASATELPQNGSSEDSSTKGSSYSSTVSPEINTSSSGTSGLPVSSPTESTTSGSRGSSPGEDEKGTESDIHYSSIILPIVITLIVITLSVFSLVALYKMCQKKTPERQENGAEQAQSDKDGVKLLSVKTTSPETVFVEARDIYEVGFSLPSANLSESTTPPPSGEVPQGRTTGEHSSQGKNKTRQLFTSQQ